MRTLFPYLKLVHVLLAIVAVGFNATYGTLMARAARGSREQLRFALESVRALDRVANWAYTFLLVTGGAMVTAGGFRWPMLWTGGSAVLLVLLLGLAHGLYTPTLKKQIAALDAGGPDAPEYQRLAKRGQSVGIALLVATLLIVALMVLKPA